MKIMVIDNYDSFVYNLVYAIRELGVQKIEIVKNDAIPMERLASFDKIVLSPGPGLPSESGQLMEVLEKYAHAKSILGVCLGHQAIAEHFGGKLLQLETPLHGVTSELQIEKNDYLLNSIPNQNPIGHYHSWVVSLPPESELEVLARDERGHIMALRHKYYDIRSVQFHPESILTVRGKQIIKNWINQ